MVCDADELPLLGSIGKSGSKVIEWEDAVLMDAARELSHWGIEFHWFGN